jgi:hypothetical protein
MRTSTVEALVWVLVYGGLLLLCLGLFNRCHAGLAAGAGGGATAAAGAC